MKKNGIKTSITYSALQFVYWMNGSVLIGFLLPFLKMMGYGEKDAGIMMALTSLFGFFLPFLFSILLDNKRIKRIIYLIGVLLLLQCLLCAVLLLSFLRHNIIVAIYLLLAGIHMSLYPLYVNLATDVFQQDNPNIFARARAFGSLGYAVMAILTGSLFAGGNPESIYRVTGAILILEILFVFMLNPYTNEKNNRNPIAKHSIDSSRSSFIIVIMMLGLALVFSGDSATNSFRYTILTSLGGNISVFSMLTAFKGLMEIPIMFLYPQLRKIGSGKLLTISVFFFLIKLILTRLASSVNLLYVALLFQSLSFGLYTPAIVHFIGQHVQPEHAASAQSLGSGMNTFGAFSATILTGYILSSRSVQYSLNVLLIIEIVGFSLYIFSRFKIRDSS